MIRYFSFFHKDTGLLHANHVAFDLNDDGAIIAAAHGNAPDGHIPVEGRYDHLSQKVDLNRAYQARQTLHKAHLANVEMLRANYQPMNPDHKFSEPPEPLFIATAEHVVNYQPPKPSDDHEWNGQTKRWVLSAAARCCSGGSPIGAPHDAAILHVG